MTQTPHLEEEEIIHLIAEVLSPILAEGARGLQDDGAWLPICPPHHTRVVTCDALAEGVDFSLALSPAQTAGYRAIVQNLSDLAAMGAQPVGFVWALEIPPLWLAQNGFLLRQFCEGALRRCQRSGFLLYGGDLSHGNRFSCSITAFGDAARPLSRQTARPGDILCVAGFVGASGKGLELLFSYQHQGLSLGKREDFENFLMGLPPDEAACIQAHVEPVDLSAYAPSIARYATAAMDVSDGLSRDLYRLCHASGVGAHIHDLDAAIHPALENDEKREKHALAGGEDYALILTFPPQTPIPTLSHNLGLSHRLHVIGHITNEKGQIFIQKNGVTTTLPKQGYDHFAAETQSIHL